MSKILRLLWLLSAVLPLSVERPAVVSASEPAEQQSESKVLLARPVRAEGQALAEVKEFCDRRIAKMPPPTSWSAWQHEADRIRERVLNKVIFRGVPRKWRMDTRRIEWLETIPGGPGYQIKKLRYEALPGLWIPALLYEPENVTVRVPVILNVNGHDSKGKAAPYKQIRCINLAKRGMYALNTEWPGMGQLNGDGFAHSRMNQLDLCGVSGLGVFYLAMERALDLLVDLPHADVERVGMAGLSGGGWQTILLSSLDPRVTLANPVAGYSSFKSRIDVFAEIGDSEQAPADLAMHADYLHLTALRAPRPTLLTYNAKDECCFVADHALQPLLNVAQPIYKLTDASSRLRWHVNVDPGTHNFLRENREAFYKMVGDHFFATEASFDSREIESEKEVQTAEELSVPLPEDNLDFHKLAVARMSELNSIKVQKGASTNQRAAELKPTRERLVRIARLVNYAPTAEMMGDLVAGKTTARYWRLKLNRDWTIPIVELSRGTPQGTVCIAADGGRESVFEQVDNLLADGYRVVAVDPFYLGESKLPENGNRLALLVSSVGARPLGVQADQLQAATRWAASQFDEPVIQVVAIGPRISLAALIAVAAADKDECPQQLVLHGSLNSLRQIIENNWTVDEFPELFCFGLLKQCDIDDLIELAKPCHVVRK
jgi:dienelactone hydrolase